MKNVLFFAIFLLVLFLVGCQSNMYEDCYSELTIEEYLKSDKSIELIELVSPTQLAQIQENGDYVLIGSSSFYALWVPRIFAIDFAKKIGASMVAFSYQQGEKMERNVTINVPTNQTVYHQGTAYGAHGSYANFHGTSTVYGTTPMNFNFEYVYYQQTAYFFGKRKNKNPFGVYFRVMENIPGNNNSKIYVAVVVKNSIAAKQGIKQGDVVVAINGKAIKNAKDIEPFVKGSEKIESVEVENE